MNKDEAEAIVAKWANKPMREVVKYDGQHPVENVLARLIEALSVTGELVKNEDGTYSLPDTEEGGEHD